MLRLVVAQVRAHHLGCVTQAHASKALVDASSPSGSSVIHGSSNLEVDGSGHCSAVKRLRGGQKVQTSSGNRQADRQKHKD